MYMQFQIHINLFSLFSDDDDDDGSANGSSTIQLNIIMIIQGVHPKVKVQLNKFQNSVAW